MKRISKLLAVALSLFMVLSLVVPAKADDLNPVEYDAVAGDEFTFVKYLVVDKNASIPDIEFTYTLEGYDAPTSSPASEQVVMGPDTVSVGTALFAPDNTTYDDPETSGDRLTLEDGKKYAKQTVTMDFSGAEFTEPGIYRYILTEEEVAGRQDVHYDLQASTPGLMTRYVDVYVINNDNDELEVAAYVMHEEDTTINIVDGVVEDANAIPTEWTFGGTAYDALDDAEAAAEDAVSAEGDKFKIGDDTENLYDTEDEAKEAAKAMIEVTKASLSDKNEFYVNEVETHNLHFGKEVKGNQGSKDKYFEFTLTLSGIPADTTIKFDLSEAETEPTKTDATEYTSMSNIADLTEVDGEYTYTFTSDEAVEFTFYLKHDQYIHVLGLPMTTEYELTEEAEDYKSQVGTSRVGVTEAWIYDGTEYDSEDAAKAQVDADMGDDADYSVIEHRAEKKYTDETSGDLTEDIYTGFTNTRGGVIPTGVIVAAVPGVILAGGALLYLFGKKRREDEV